MIQLQSRIKKIFLLTIVLITLGCSFFYFIKNRSNKIAGLEKTEQKKCISDGLEVSYLFDENMGGQISGIPKLPVSIQVKDQNDRLLNSFFIEYGRNYVNGIQIRDCSIYIIEVKNERKEGKTLRYLAEIRRYDFFGENNLVLTLVTDNSFDKKSNILYSLKFDVSNSEKYISLVQGYVGSEDYALHIKDIETKENIVEVNLTSDLFIKYPNIAGDVEFRGWSEDEKYFWFSLFDQANVLAYVRVNMENGDFGVFEAPVGTMNQDAFNVNTGWVTYDDGPPWTGVREFEEEYQQEWEEAGDFVTFSIYNIFSKQKIDLEKTTNTTWWHYPKWLDDETLEYKLPSGEIKKYNLK